MENGSAETPKQKKTVLPQNIRTITSISVDFHAAFQPVCLTVIIRLLGCYVIDELILKTLLTCLDLFYNKRLRNHVLCTFVFTFL